MAVSYTYDQFANQIAWELGNRTDLLSDPTGGTLALSPIQQAIQNAIAKWEREHFYFNELSPNGQVTFSTAPGKEYYTATDSAYIGTNPHLDKVWILVSSNRYSLNPRTEQYMSDTSLNPRNQGQPVDYSMYAETMRLYPIPDGAYPITLEGTQRYAPLVLGTDTNVWLQDAADLIKTEAKLDLYENVLQENDRADRMRVLIHGNPQRMEDTGFLYALRSESAQRTAVGKMRGMYY